MANDPNNYWTTGSQPNANDRLDNVVNDVIRPTEHVRAIFDENPYNPGKLRVIKEPIVLGKPASAPRIDTYCGPDSQPSAKQLVHDLLNPSIASGEYLILAQNGSLVINEYDGEKGIRTVKKYASYDFGRYDFVNYPEFAPIDVDYWYKNSADNREIEFDYPEFKGTVGQALEEEILIHGTIKIPFGSITGKPLAKTTIIASLSYEYTALPIVLLFVAGTVTGSEGESISKYDFISIPERLAKSSSIALIKNRPDSDGASWYDAVLSFAMNTCWPTKENRILRLRFRSVDAKTAMFLFGIVESSNPGNERNAFIGTTSDELLEEYLK